MGEGVKLGGIFERLGREGVGEDREEEGTGTRRMGVVGMLRFTNAGLVNFPWALASHSFSFSSSLPLAFFLLSLSLDFASNIICNAGVGGSHRRKPTLRSTN
jgi:hypothetical protein